MTTMKKAATALLACGGFFLLGGCDELCSWSCSSDSEASETKDAEATTTEQPVVQDDNSEDTSAALPEPGLDGDADFFVAMF